MKTMAVTGHRPNKLGGYGEAAHNQRLRLATAAVRHYAPQQVITGMALGWDQAIAQACVDLKVPFLAYVPFEGQESAWPSDSQRYYHELLRKAAEVKFICGPGYAAWKMQKRNEAMVDECNRLVALWDGSSGGTANCIAYARSLPRLTTNLWTTWRKM